MTTSRLARVDNTITISSQALSCQAPSAVLITAGVTSGTIVWNSASGGLPPYTYSSASVVYDSSAESTTAVLAATGDSSSPGTSTLSSLVNGQTITLTRTVTDSEGKSIDVQSIVSVAASAATITAGAAPANQVLAAGTTSATIGTWGEPTGGTGPYTYTLTEPGGSGSTITGSDLGSWSVSGLTDGVTYAFLLAITDSLNAKGYSIVTVSVRPSLVATGWEVVDSTDFEDSNWSALSSTSTAQSTTDWQHTLYAADGVTARAYVYNNSSAARTLSLSPNDVGLKLANGTATVQPQIGVWPAGWASMLGGSRKDIWLIEAIVGGEEPSGSASFSHHMNITTSSTSNVVSPATGIRVIETGSNISLRASSYISGLSNQVIQTIAAGDARIYTCGFQVTIADSRRHDVYVSVGATDFSTPLSGQRVRVQASSTAMTAPGADVTTSASWFASTISGRTKFGLYHDGSSATGSYIVLKKLRLLRKINGSF